MVKGNEDDYGLLLEAANAVEADLAKNLLSEAGIPAFAQGPDFDIAELGVVAHAMLRGTRIYVTKENLKRAQALLEGAWGKRD